MPDDAVKAGVKPLPSHLTERYKDWLKNGYDAALCSQLAQGQNPHSMVISCCDSRVNATKFFMAENGELFIHRNIANIVPAHGVGHHSTAAAVEYAVTALKVSHIIIIGHSACGGIKGGFSQCDAASTDSGSLSKWLELVKPAYDRLDHSLPSEAQITMLEKLSIIVSLEHLMTYDFVRHAVETRELSIHGLWHDIGSGSVLNYRPELDDFAPL